MGFPDGALTELERAQRPLFQLYSAGNLALALLLGVIGVKWLPNSRFWKWCFWSGVAIFVTAWIGFAWVNYWMGTFLADGRGG